MNFHSQQLTCGKSRIFVQAGLSKLCFFSVAMENESFQETDDSFIVVLLIVIHDLCVYNRGETNT